VLWFHPFKAMPHTPYEDRMLLHDMYNVGLIDASWLNRLPPELTPRRQDLLDNPEG
jgi:hypothetical protein